VTLPRKWPVPAAGQVLTVTKPYTEGWISAWFWAADTGFHFVFQAITGDRMIENASDKPLSAAWIPVIGTTHMLSRGADARLIATETLLGMLDDWRAEIIQRKAA
jgi:hypothetical protein